MRLLTGARTLGGKHDCKLGSTATTALSRYPITDNLCNDKERFKLKVARHGKVHKGLQRGV